ncbi:MAG: hypothetical protein HAW67_05145, partial [Endozoicomonadaceae bacterium]|nr:hypothetical protein [Endozoicomonadaceae bacterium]
MLKLTIRNEIMYDKLKELDARIKKLKEVNADGEIIAIGENLKSVAWDGVLLGERKPKTWELELKKFNRKADKL